MKRKEKNMDKTAITERAKDYIAREKDENFRAEVEKLLAAEDWMNWKTGSTGTWNSAPAACEG